VTEGRPRVALITGTSGEIGRHLARHLLDGGWTVLGIDKDPPSAEAPGGLVFRQCDLSEPAAATAAVDDLLTKHGAADALINCAGLIANAPLVRLGSAGWEVHDFALWRDIVASGLTTAFHATALTVKHMLEARRTGVIVNMSSVCAAGNPGQVAYSAAKAGLNGLTLALAKELGPVGIRVVGLAPGYFDTRSTRTNVPAAKLTKLTSAVPLRRLGLVEEIATTIDFIIANEYVNGTVIELDGGLVL
jgi:3-oxoacyl-[acyl-carrier protein] reductase